MSEQKVNHNYVPPASVKVESADEMFKKLRYHSVMKCLTRRCYQKVKDHHQYDIVIDKKKIWKDCQDIICPCNNSDMTWWTPEELLAAAKSFQEMEEEGQ